MSSSWDLATNSVFHNPNYAMFIFLKVSIKKPFFKTTGRIQVIGHFLLSVYNNLLNKKCSCKDYVLFLSPLQNLNNICLSRWF